MVDILAENLSGKSVMGENGTELGDLSNITMEMKTGGLRHLLVVPKEGTSAQSTEFDDDETGRLKIPIGSVKSVTENIVVYR